MILQRVESPDFLSNAYLVVDKPGGHGVLIDSNGVTEPLLERVEREGTTLTHVLLTHHHWDHVLGAMDAAERFEVPLLAHPLAEDAGLEQFKVTETMAEGDVIESGDLWIDVLETPGHCADHLALVVNGSDCLTADVLFKGTVGGTRAPGATGFADLRSSVMEKLMKLPPETRVHPGHRARPRSAMSGSQTPSSAFGGASTRKARSPARSARLTRRSAKRRPSSSGPPTTTAATKPGCALRAAKTRSSAARRSGAATEPR